MKEKLTFARSISEDETVIDSTFFTTYLSNTLFNINACVHLRIWEENTFSNIWLIDQAMPTTTNDYQVNI